MVAVVSLQLARLPRPVAAVMTWAGLGGILVAAFTYNSATPYPGVAVALPVISTTLIVAGGMARPRAGAEVLLRVPPFQWMGKLSYSLYLWHWPILIIAPSTSVIPSRSRTTFSGCCSLSGCRSAPTSSLKPHQALEVLDPLRRKSVSLGGLLVALSLVVATFEIASHS